MMLGATTPLTQGERELAGEFNLTPIAPDRAWEQWSRRGGTTVTA